MNKNDVINSQEMRDLSFDQYFELFLKDECIYGNWLDWHNDWADFLKNRSAYQKDEYLIIYYEDLLSNFEKTVVELGKFIGLSGEEVVDEMDCLKEMGNFKSMQEKYRPPNIKNFVRKGIVGDFENYFSEGQKKRMDEEFVEALDPLFSHRYQ